MFSEDLLRKAEAMLWRESAIMAMALKKIFLRQLNLRKNQTNWAVRGAHYITSIGYEVLWNQDGDKVSIWAHTGGTAGFPKTVLLADKAYNVVAMQYKMSMAHRRGKIF